MRGKGVQIVIGQPTLYEEYLDMRGKGSQIVLGQPSLNKKYLIHYKHMFIFRTPCILPKNQQILNFSFVLTIFLPYF